MEPKFTSKSRKYFTEGSKSAENLVSRNIAFTFFAKTLAMDHIPVTFEHQGKEYSGVLSVVAGVGHSSVWHLMINNYYYGCLMYTDGRWIFHSEKLPGIADLLGDYVMGPYQ